MAVLGTKMGMRLGMVAVGVVLASAAPAIQGNASTPPSAPAAPSGKVAPTAAPPGVAQAAAPAGSDPMKAGRELFANWSCGSCHTLADAGAEGHVGPSFDGNTALSEALVKDRVTNGQGAMPAFGGQMTDPEIATIAAYIVKAKK